MNKIVKENGFLSEHGLNFVQEFEQTISDIVSTFEVQEMTNGEVLALQSNMSKILAEQFSKFFQEREEQEKLAAQFSTMTDEEFGLYLKLKYNSPFASLTPAELARLPKLTKAQMDATMEKARKAAQEFKDECPSVHVDPNIRFR